MTTISTLLSFVFWFSASFGIQEYTETNIYNDWYIHPPIVAEIDIHAESQLIDIYAKYNNEMDFGTWTFKPKQDYFVVGFKVKAKSLSFSMEHMCQNPIGSYKESLDGEYGSYNKIEISFSSKDR